MGNFILYTVKTKTLGADTQVNLRLEVSRATAPKRLSDFCGGVAELYDGFSTTKIDYSISLADYDDRRIKLTSINGIDIELNPEFVKEKNPEFPFFRLREIPLRPNQELSEYIIVNSTWSLS